MTSLTQERPSVEQAHIEAAYALYDELLEVAKVWETNEGVSNFHKKHFSKPIVELTLEEIQSVIDIYKAPKHKAQFPKYVKCSDITSGHVVGFTKEGLSIVAVKKTVKGCPSICCYLADSKNPYNDPFLINKTRRKFPTVKAMVEYINSIYDAEQTDLLSW